MHAWSRDGSELLYVAPDRTLMSASIRSTGGSLQAGVPVPLFKLQIAGSVNGYDYAAAPDGRFLVNVAPSASPAAQAAPITVILNWASSFKK
jgi:hypothetical protein